MANKSYWLYALLTLLLVGFLVSRERQEATSHEERSAKRDREKGGGFGRGLEGSEARSSTRKRSLQHSSIKKIQTSSGLVYQVLKKGTGDRPVASDTVKVIYCGYFPDGEEFDRSPDDQPITFPLGAVIKGWGEGLQLMQVGAKYRFIIPPELAYGERGASYKIGPNQTLVFDVELVGIEKKDSSAAQ